MCRIELIIDELKLSNLIMGNSVPKKVLTLFNEQYIFDIKFNGFDDLEVYRMHLQGTFRKCKTRFDRKLNKINDNGKMIIHLEMAVFEIQQVKRDYLTENKQIMKHVKVDKSYRINEKYENIVYDMISYFYELKRQLANNLIEYFKHRIGMIKQSIHLGFPLGLNRTPKRNVSNHNQLSLFPKREESPLIKWNRSAADFMELIYALLGSNSIIRKDGVLSRKDLTAFFSWLFNFQIKDPEGTLKAAKQRKKSSSPFLQELVNVFDTSAENSFA